MATNITHFPVLIPDGHRGERGLSSPKANSHPYAIKTTSTAILSRSNSNSHNFHSSHSYIPPSPLQSPDTRHRHTKSETSIDVTSATSSPRPLPIPPSSKGSNDITSRLHSPSRSLSPERIAQINSLSPFKADDLPSDPRSWTPSELANYLIVALPVARPVARDIADFMKSKRMTGRMFLRISEADLEELKLNHSWCNMILDASNVLRQNSLKGRIWGFEVTETDNLKRLSLFNSSSSSIDLSSTPAKKSNNGHVRGIVASYEKNRSSSFSSASESDADEDIFGSGISPDRRARRKTVRPLNTEKYIESPTSSDSSVLSDLFTPLTFAENEPSVEELLAVSSNDNGLANSWGAKAWEELDDKACTKVTMKWVGNESSTPIAMKLQGNATITEFFQRPPDEKVSSRPLPSPPITSSPTLSSTNLYQNEDNSKFVMNAISVNAVTLESQILENRLLAERLRVRLEELEHNLAKAEQGSVTEIKQYESRGVQAEPDSTAPAEVFIDHFTDDQQDTSLIIVDPTSLENASATTYDDEHSLSPSQYWRDLTNAKSLEWDPIESSISSYILMVGFGVCTVVVQSMLKRWAYRKP